MSMQALFGTERRVLDPLSRGASPSSLLGDVVRDSCLRLLDSRTIIAASPGERRRMSGTSLALPALVTSTVDQMDELLGTEPCALPQLLPSLMQRFGATLLALCGDEAQRRNAAEWAAAGTATAFMMTDSGGSSVHQWRSTAVREAEGFRLTVDKRWILGGLEAGAGIVAVRGEAPQYPVLFQVAPEEYGGLTAASCGPAFLGEDMRLGNVSGEIRVPACRLLRRNQILGARTFLGLIRPRFVVAVMGHVLALARSGVLGVTDQSLALVEEVRRLALDARARTEFGVRDIDRSLALKLVANEVLLKVAGEVALRSPVQARDLLGLSKMEGSSYRCFLELMT